MDHGSEALKVEEPHVGETTFKGELGEKADQTGNNHDAADMLRLVRRQELSVRLTRLISKPL